MSETIQHGDRTEVVEQMQRLLQRLTFYSATIDGHFGDATLTALRAYREWRGYGVGDTADAHMLEVMADDAERHAPSDAGADATGEHQADGAGAAASADPHDGIRQAAISIAMAEIGKVKAYTAESTDEDGRELRHGWERLKQYFDIAAPSVWSDDIVKYVGPGLPSWCGIFALWALKSAGATGASWQMGSGFPDVKFIARPQPGDIGYIEKNQHYCLIVRVEGDTIYSVDGNTVGDDTGGGEVNDRTRSKSQYAGFLSVFH